MSELLEKLALCVEKGKINREMNYPRELAGQDGADELAKKALEQGLTPYAILHQACIVGMHRIGEQFKQGKAYVPQLLIAAKAMQSVMDHLRPFFESGEIKTKGTFVIGTVSGDLHNIGKNLVCMVVGGAGWKVVDLGVDVATPKFLKAIADNALCVVGLSALLTTTMVNMEATARELKQQYPDTQLIVGGAPLSREFAEQIGADGFADDPQGAVDFLNAMVQ